MIDLILPSSRTLTEDCLNKGIIVGYLNGNPHGLITLYEDSYDYNRTSNVSDYDVSRESLFELVEELLKRYPGISFKMLETE